MASSGSLDAIGATRVQLDVSGMGCEACEIYVKGVRWLHFLSFLFLVLGWFNSGWGLMRSYPALRERRVVPVCQAAILLALHLYFGLQPVVAVRVLTIASTPNSVFSSQVLDGADGARQLRHCFGPFLTLMAIHLPTRAV